MRRASLRTTANTPSDVGHCVAPSRRAVLALLAAAVAGPAMAGTVPLKVLMLSDLHSAYGAMPALLQTMRDVVRQGAGRSLILLDGDLFEAGNVVARRTGGALDWAFLDALTKLAPVVLNLGNHDSDLVPSPAETAARAKALGITVISTIRDARSGQPLAPPEATLDLGFPVHLTGIATNSIDTYPAAVRPALDIPAPADWARMNLPKAPPHGGVVIVMSHAGLPADRQFLDRVPDGSLVLGGHDHLVIDQPFGHGRYVHTGAWGAVLSMATIAPGRPVQLRQLTTDPGGPSDPAIKALIQTTLAATLTPAETAIVAAIPATLSLGDTGREVAALMAKAAGCDVGFMGHTTLGMGLPAGPLTQYAYDAVVRFDGTVMKAEVDAATLAGLMARSNQDRDTPFERRTGDFVYGAPAIKPGQARYSIATTDWCAGHQQTYFGRTDLAFAALPGLKVKDAIKKGLPQ